MKAGRQPTSPIRAVVGDGESLHRAGVTHVLQEAGIEVVAWATNADDLARKSRAYHPDVAVMDLDASPRLSEVEWVHVVRTIRAADPRMAILILSHFAAHPDVLTLLGDHPEGFGYLVKAQIRDLEDFTASVRRVARGGTAIDPALVSRLLARRRASDPISDLTRREREVLALMAEGRSNRYIAAELVVTVAAVERHITSILAKLGVGSDRDHHRRVLAVLRYLSSQQRVDPATPPTTSSSWGSQELNLRPPAPRAGSGSRGLA